MNNEPLSISSQITCILSGTLFALGWWTVAIAMVMNYGITNNAERFSYLHILLPLTSTLGLLLMTGISRNAILADRGMFGESSGAGPTLLLFLFIAITMSGFGLSLALYLIYHQTLKTYYYAALIPVGSGLIAFRYFICLRLVDFTYLPFIVL